MPMPIRFGTEGQAIYKKEVRTLDRLSKIIMAVGGIISATAMCCLDSDGVYMYYAGAVCIMGGFVIGAGYGLLQLSRRRQEKREAYFYMVHRQDWLDVEFIGIEEVGK